MKVKGSCQRKFAKDSGNANTTSLALGSETGAQVYAGLEWSRIWETLPLHDPETKEGTQRLLFKKSKHNL